MKPGSTVFTIRIEGYREPVIIPGLSLTVSVVVLVLIVVCVCGSLCGFAYWYKTSGALKLEVWRETRNVGNEDIDKDYPQTQVIFPFFKKL